MKKRQRSPADGQEQHARSAKGKGRPPVATAPGTPRPPTFAGLTEHQEIFLRILSFLSPNELAQVQGVNRYWAHMTLDPQVSLLLCASAAADVRQRC